MILLKNAAIFDGENDELIENGFVLVEEDTIGFKNVGETDAVLLTTITGPVDAHDDVGVPPSVGEEVLSRFGDKVLDAFKKIATFRDS